MIAFVEDEGAGSTLVLKRWGSASSRWETLPSPGHGSRVVDSPSLALDEEGAPILAWSEGFNINAFDAFVSRWNSNTSTWEELGGPLDVSPDQGARQPHLVRDAAGRLTVAWAEQTASATNDIHVKQWSQAEGQWLSLGDAAGAGAFPAIATGPDGRPVAVWREGTDPAMRVQVKDWNPSSTEWNDLGAVDEQTSSFTTPPAIAVDAAGAPIVAWTRYDGTTHHLFVARREGGTWAPLGQALENATAPDVRVSAEGTLFLLYQELDPAAHTGTLQLRTWDPAAAGWVAFGEGLEVTSGAKVRESILALDPSGRPVVAWTDWDGTSFNLHVAARE